MEEGEVKRRKLRRGARGRGGDGEEERGGRGQGRRGKGYTRDDMSCHGELSHYTPYVTCRDVLVRSSLQVYSPAATVRFLAKQKSKDCQYT